MTATREADPYNELVRQYFANPVHAGEIPEEYNDALSGEASESGAGARVVLSATVDGESIHMLRYRICGCPHLIAAAEAFCAEAEGKPIAALNKLDVKGLMEKLAIPVEKTGSVYT
jgi:NifU-like protein involved in Fe-S cluster formation